MSDKITTSSSTDTTSPLGLRLLQRMAELNINNSELSRKSGVSRAVISNIIRRPEKKVMSDSACDLAEALKCRVEWFIKGEGPIEDVELDAYYRAKKGVPVIDLDEFTSADANMLISDAQQDSTRKRYNCPIDISDDSIVVIVDRDMGKLEKGTLVFIDLTKKKPRTGQIVLASTSQDSILELYGYSSSPERGFLKTLSDDDLPQAFKFLEVGDNVTIYGSSVATAKI